MIDSERVHRTRASGGGKKIRVLLGDEHPVVRRRLRQILEDAPTVVVTGEAGSAGEVVEQLRQGGCDVLLLEPGLSGVTGFDLLEQVVTEFPTVSVLVLTMQPDDSRAVQALRAGAAGLIAKDSAPESVVDAVRRLAAGGRYLTASVTERLAADVLGNRAGRNPHELLSNRELQVLCMLGKGQSVSEVGRMLRLSVKTVSTYRARILEKLALQTTADLIRYAIRGGLVD